MLDQVRNDIRQHSAGNSLVAIAQEIGRDGLKATPTPLRKTAHKFSEYAKARLESGAFRARLSVLLAALLPMSIWLFSTGHLAHPVESIAWALLCALIAASPPGNGVRFTALLQCLMLPWTLSWVGAVAATGMGPSTASLESLTAGAYKEVATAAMVALQTPGFQIVALASLLSAALALRSVRRQHFAPSKAANLIFLSSLIVGSAPVLEGVGLYSISRLAGPEARISVPWLSHLEALRIVPIQLAMADDTPQEYARSALSARQTFTAEPGLAVFVVGESLRADALMKSGRGIWSDALQQRVNRGLGVRLPDACAGGNGTFVSVPKLITASEGASPWASDHKPTILALAKAGGAKTAYINNHEIWVVPETGHDLMQKTSALQFNTFDEVAIEALDDFVKKTDANSRAVLIHLYGQHFFYEDRYPFWIFGQEPEGLAKNELIELRYQRAAEYGAKVLVRAAEVLDSLSTPAYLVFTSDHGENLASDATGKQYHSGPTSGRNDTTVPVLVLWNQSFADSRRQERLAPLLENNKALAHRDVALAWLRLMGAPGPLKASDDPITWGALRVGEATGPLRCAELGP